MSCHSLLLDLRDPLKLNLLAYLRSLSNAFDVFEHAEDAAPPQVVPALHVLYALRSPSPLQPSSTSSPADFESIRGELIELIAQEGLDGDVEAAEWVLLALIARM